MLWQRKTGIDHPRDAMADPSVKLFSSARTPPDILLLYAARALRGLGDGFAAILLPVYLSAIGLSAPYRRRRPARMAHGEALRIRVIKAVVEDRLSQRGGADFPGRDCERIRRVSAFEETHRTAALPTGGTGVLC